MFRKVWLVLVVIVMASLACSLPQPKPQVGFPEIQAAAAAPETSLENQQVQVTPTTQFISLDSGEAVEIHLMSIPVQQPNPQTQVLNLDEERGGGRILSDGTVIDVPYGQSQPVVPWVPGTDQDLNSFATSVINGQPDMVVGVYVPGLFAFPVVEQPNGEVHFVSTQLNVVTRYSTPALFGAIALVAHNDLSGSAFFQLGNKQEVTVIYGDGRPEDYRVEKIESFQALSPNDPYSNFVDLNTEENPILSHEQMFNRVYTHAGTLVFQTCIERDGVPTWGRLFVTASKPD